MTHSRNIAVRPEVDIVVFDSQAAIGTGQGVYMSAAAKLLEIPGMVIPVEAKGTAHR